MATLGELKSRVRTECNRDDLNDELADALNLAVARAIEFYADEKFWFNTITTTVTCTTGSNVITVPSEVRKVERVVLPVLNTELQETLLTELENGHYITYRGPPMRYAYNNNELRLFPVPERNYTLQIIGLRNLDAVITEADNEWSPDSSIGEFGAEPNNTSAWTNEAQDLIAARARFTLMRDQFRDPEGAQLAAGAAQEALDRLRKETARRLVTPLRVRRDMPVQGDRFRFNAGW